MQRLQQCLDKLDKHNKSIATLYFKPPGIYNNAVSTINDDAENITSLIRDVHTEEETELYSVDEHQTVRKDGQRIGIMDYLSTLNSDSQTTGDMANMTSQGSKPVITVPMEYYLKQNELMLESANRSNRNKRRRTGTAALDEIFFSRLDENAFVFDILLKKFSNDSQMRSLIMALRDGSVLDEGAIASVGGEGANSGDHRRRTLFVEDFPSDCIFKIFQEIVTNWPLNEYNTKFNSLLERFNLISDQVNELKEHISMHEEDGVSIEQLIDKEEAEIEILKLQLQQMD
ncbi:hypothetical protein ACO0RG_004527 [Hanseniaspora osmophila]|uniref:DASH complex subunit SPC34 n=1 Tax=Hanseniaspora osmophila TaxID=56408 RepID=A0A1E5S0C4_9ASCO|nr:DASH complex subunit SPC34 [Hanseniaspora osmophila]